MEQSNEKEIDKASRAESGLRIFHPVCGAPDIYSPFCHALKLAWLSRGRLEIVDLRDRHAGAEGLSIRKILMAWGALSPEATREDVAELGFTALKIRQKGNEHTMVLRRLERKAQDLLVVAYDASMGSGAIFSRSLPHWLFSRMIAATLFVPSQSGFVNRNSGALTLARVVMPVAARPSAAPALAFLERLVRRCDIALPRIDCIHAGQRFPALPPHPFDLRERLLDDMPIPALSAFVAEAQPDCILMPTDGRNTMTQKIIGSFTEQLLNTVPCPVLAVPSE